MRVVGKEGALGGGGVMKWSSGMDGSRKIEGISMSSGAFERSGKKNYLSRE